MSEPYWETPTIDDAYTYNDIDAVVMENAHLRAMVLPGKGGDILEFRDKSSDVDVLWQAEHEWVPPDTRVIPTADATTWHDHYPGGWQLNLPVAGYTDDFAGTPYGLHGESALLPWDTIIARDDADAVSVHLSVDLIRYPFHVERELTLPADESVLHIEESVTNEGRVELEYIWQQHIALGPPLIGPDARLDIPADTGVVEDYDADHENARLESGARFDWPEAPGADGTSVDLSAFPDYDACIHDVAYATDLEDGWYAVTNPAHEVGFGFAFPTDPFECVWYWQPFNGFAESPYWGRNYNVGLEPTSAYPSGDIPDAQRANGTMKTLGPGETIEATYAATTFSPEATVASIDSSGQVRFD